MVFSIWIKSPDFNPTRTSPTTFFLAIVSESSRQSASRLV